MWLPESVASRQHPGMTFRFQLHTGALHLNGVGPFEHHEATSDFWSDRTRPEFRTGHILSTFDSGVYGAAAVGPRRLTRKAGREPGLRFDWEL